jgi:uncharacterized membrane protein
MAASPLIEFIASEHPAFVHVPLGLVATLPLAMLASFRSKVPHRWTRTAFFMGLVGLGSSAVAIFSGLMWGRQIALIPGGGFIPVISSGKQVIQKVLQLHELAALGGFAVGCVCVTLLWQAWHKDNRSRSEGVPPHRRHMDRRLWERGVGVPALAAGILWLGAWGFCGKLGGIMVFGSEATNRAAAEADAARRADKEAEVPIRALDYASLEPAQTALFRSKAHGNRWGRIWVTASAIDAYQAGKSLEPGAYAVMSTYEDHKGKPSQDVGPLYFLEIASDGKPKFAFYWPRVPEGQQAAMGGEDSVYWRSPDPHLASCQGCHTKGSSTAR